MCVMAPPAIANGPTLKKSNFDFHAPSHISVSKSTPLAVTGPNGQTGEYIIPTKPNVSSLRLKRNRGSELSLQIRNVKSD